jgi:VanZ family protein
MQQLQAPQEAERNRAAPSAFARAGLLAYTMLIVYASWFPFTGWRDIGVSPFAYLSARLPHYWTGFDVSINIVGYVPYGLFLVCSLYPRLRGVKAAIVASLIGILTSGTMEAVQTFLPSRVASNLDLLTNSAGACIGAIAGALLTPLLLQESPILFLRRRWFAPDAGRGMILMGLWPLAQIYPQEYLFGHGQMLPILSDWLSQWLDADIDLGDLLRFGHQLSIEQYWLAETFIAACSLIGTVLMLFGMLRQHAPKIRLALLLLATGLTAKAMATALFFGPQNAFAWLTPGAETGLLVGILLIAAMTLTSSKAQRRVATLLLAISFIAVNLAPTNPYFVATLQTWVQGQFLNFNGAAQFLTLWWPLVALAFLLRRSFPARLKAN